MNGQDDAVSLNGTRFVVLMNAEGAHSIWPAAKPAPAGWEQVGEPASRAACLELVEARWTDMRPRSLRLAMDGDVGR